MDFSSFEGIEVGLIVTLFAVFMKLGLLSLMLVFNRPQALPTCMCAAMVGWTLLVLIFLNQPNLPSPAFSFILWCYFALALAGTIGFAWLFFPEERSQLWKSVRH